MLELHRQTMSDRRRILGSANRTSRCISVSFEHIVWRDNSGSRQRLSIERDDVVLAKGRRVDIEEVRIVTEEKWSCSPI
jgi:hypothetical protein